MKKRHQFQREQPAQTARQIALRLLQQFDKHGDYLSMTISSPEYNDVPAMEKRLALELAETTLIRSFAIDRLLRQVMTRKKSETHPALWIVLQLGCAQLFFLPEIPSHAAINETVELARFVNKPHLTTLINGVLRSLQRLQVEKIPARFTVDDQSKLTLTETTVEATAITRYLPLGGDDGWLLNQDLYRMPGIEEDHLHSIAAYLSHTTSLPDWLIRRWWIGLEGSPREKFIQIQQRGLTFLQSTLLTLRLNRLQIDRPSYLKMLEEAGIPAVAGEQPMSVRLLKNSALDQMPGFREGMFSIQDETAMKAAQSLDVFPHQHVLDLCAAPGGKTTHLAELMNDQGMVVACDIQSWRLKRVQENVERLKLKSVHSVLIGEDGSGLPERRFDRILVDAPCSNTGVLHKRPEVRCRLSEADIDELAELQRRLVDRAISRLKPEGRIVYSTCSLEAQENEEQVRALLAQHQSLELIGQERSEPSAWTDGGFIALFRKSSEQAL